MAPSPPEEPRRRRLLINPTPPLPKVKGLMSLAKFRQTSVVLHGLNNGDWFKLPCIYSEMCEHPELKKVLRVGERHIRKAVCCLECAFDLLLAYAKLKEISLRRAREHKDDIMRCVAGVWDEIFLETPRDRSVPAVFNEARAVLNTCKHIVQSEAALADEKRKDSPSSSRTESGREDTTLDDSAAPSSPSTPTTPRTPRTPRTGPRTHPRTGSERKHRSGRRPPRLTEQAAFNRQSMGGDGAGEGDGVTFELIQAPGTPGETRSPRVKVFQMKDLISQIDSCVAKESSRMHCPEESEASASSTRAPSCVSTEELQPPAIVHKDSHSSRQGCSPEGVVYAERGGRGQRQPRAAESPALVHRDPPSSRQGCGSEADLLAERGGRGQRQPRAAAARDEGDAVEELRTPELHKMEKKKKAQSYGCIPRISFG